MKKIFGLLACLVIATLVHSATLPSTLADRDRRSTNGGEKPILSYAVPSIRSNVLQDYPQEPVVAGEVIKSQRHDPQLSKLLRKYDLIKLDRRAAASQIRKTGRLLFNTSKHQFDLQLVVNDMRSADYVAQTIGSDGVAHKLSKLPVNTYKGRVPGWKARRLVW